LPCPSPPRDESACPNPPAAVSTKADAYERPTRRYLARSGCRGVLGFSGRDRVLSGLPTRPRLAFPNARPDAPGRGGRMDGCQPVSVSGLPSAAGRTGCHPGDVSGGAPRFRQPITRAGTALDSRSARRAWGHGAVRSGRCRRQRPARPRVSCDASRSEAGQLGNWATGQLGDTATGRYGTPVLPNRRIA